MSKLFSFVIIGLRMVGINFCKGLSR